MTTPVWTDAANHHYTLAVQGLIEHIKVKFPRKCDSTKVAKCKQQKGEAVDKYLNRLTEVYNEFSGAVQPADLGCVLGTWEQGLINAFRNGLLPQITKAVNKSCVGIDVARLTTVQSHAEHADRLMREAGEAEDKKMNRATFAMMKTLTNDRRRAPSRERERADRYEKGACHICGRMGHWARQCRDKGRRQGQNQEREREDQVKESKGNRRARFEEDPTQSN